MNSPSLLTIAAIALAGCTVTGDPRAGGLFGWSESMARNRIEDRRIQVATAEEELAREQRRSSAASQRMRAVERQEASAARERNRAEQNLAAREAASSVKAAQLEADSPTPASASRAHRLRRSVEAIRNDGRLSPVERARELRRLEVEIDAARASMRR